MHERVTRNRRANAGFALSNPVAMEYVNKLSTEERVALYREGSALIVASGDN